MDYGDCQIKYFTNNNWTLWESIPSKTLVDRRLGNRNLGLGVLWISHSITTSTSWLNTLPKAFVTFTLYLPPWKAKFAPMILYLVEG